MNQGKLHTVFFGTDEFSIAVLEELEKADLLPTLIVTAPDKPVGRKQVITPPPVKVWAKEKHIDILQPEKLDEIFTESLAQLKWDMFLVASYGKIIPQRVLDIPEKGSLNVHPSLLPLYRGASPIESAILDDNKQTGVTIILMDEKMDHGPILNQEFVSFEKWPTKLEVENKLAHIGGELLAVTIPDWADGNIEEQEQDHDAATFTKLIKKEDGEIKLDGDARANYLKYVAYDPWPGVFYFENDKRMKITKARFEEGKFIIERIIPEGQKERDF